jgi:nitrite reductase (NADH) large subunit
VQDSVGFAIRVENRYKGLRAPHKIKAAVSGCIRECAEAQCKDFGLIATEKGYNLYVCGNGGSKPRHADLLAADLDEATALKYIDRFLMYYIQTADRLTRTSVWLENLPGGITYLREVIIDDRLKLAEELERQMQSLVDSYKCEWTEVVNDPARRRWFRQFMNTEETESVIEFVHERGQRRPADWRKDPAELPQLDPTAAIQEPSSLQEVPRTWVRVGLVDDFPKDGGSAIKYGQSQIAVFRFESRGEWYATQNMCPHKQSFVLSRGIIGDHSGTPKVACPLHKKTFSLEDGACLSGENYSLQVFPVKVEGDEVYLQLPPEEVLDAALATEHHCIRACEERAGRQEDSMAVA